MKIYENPRESATPSHRPGSLPWKTFPGILVAPWNFKERWKNVSFLLMSEPHKARTCIRKSMKINENLRKSINISENKRKSTRINDNRGKSVEIHEQSAKIHKNI